MHSKINLRWIDEELSINTKVKYTDTITEDFLWAEVDKWKSEFPEMGICAFLPEADKNKLPIVQNALSKKGIPLVGAIFPELVHENQFKKEGILLFCFEKMPFYQLFEDLSEGGTSIAKQIGNHLGKN